MVLICIHLLANDVEYLFTCVFSFLISSLGKCLFRFVTHFLIAFVIFIVDYFLYLLDTSAFVNM